MQRKCRQRTLIATAHKLLCVVHSVLPSYTPYRDPEADREALMVRRNAPRRIRMLQSYGHLHAPDRTTATSGPAAMQ